MNKILQNYNNRKEDTTEATITILDNMIFSIENIYIYIQKQKNIFQKKKNEIK